MKKITYYITLCVAIVFTACTNDMDNLFNASPAQRVADKNNLLLNKLLNEKNGYKAEYFTRNDKYGGFTFIMRFKSDGNVDMTSDFDNDTNIESSTYEVRLGTTNELVFTTGNHIQKVSDPSLNGGKGFEGTSVFQYFGEENGSLIFKDVRNKNTSHFKLTPTGFTNFNTQSVESVKKSKQNREQFINSIYVTAFAFLSVNDGTTNTKYDLKIDDYTYVAKCFRINAEGLIVSDLNFGILFTENGLIISPAINVNGTLVSEFTLDASSGLQYKATVNGVTAIIGYDNSPIIPIPAYVFTNFGGQFSFFNNAAPNESSKTSYAFREFFKNFNDDYRNKYNEEVIGHSIVNIRDSSRTNLNINTTTNSYYWSATYTVTNGVYKFTLTGDTNADANTQNALQPLINEILLGPLGYYLIDTGTAEYSTKTFTMINVENPSMYLNYSDCCG